MMNCKRIFILFIILALTGCAATKKDWDKAQRLNTIRSYQAFLTKHPQSEFTEEAKLNIKNLDWQEAKNSNTIESYQKFIDKYPGSEYIDEARNRMLVKLIIAMAPPTAIKLDDRGQIVQQDWNPESSQSLWLPKLKKLLEEGADPNALRIKGFNPLVSSSTTKDTWHSTFAVRGEEGTIVGPDEDGQDLLSFCREFQLLQAAELLTQHGAK
jgi:hypothetical protein